MNVHSFSYLCSMNKKEIILKTTLDLVNKQGFYHLNMKQLAQEANVAAGTIYLYFDSKESLINELYKQIKKEFHDSILQGYQAKRDFQSNFFEMLGNAMQYYIAHSDCFSFIEQYTYSPFLFKETQEENLAILQPLQIIIQKAKANNDVKDLPENLLVALCHGPLVSMMKLYIAGKADLANPSTQEQLVEACWQMIKK